MCRFPAQVPRVHLLLPGAYDLQGQLQDLLRHRVSSPTIDDLLVVGGREDTDGETNESDLKIPDERRVHSNYTGYLRAQNIKHKGSDTGCAQTIRKSKCSPFMDGSGDLR
ncbi:hypothetical protein GDO81_024666 [Engystomops pustulosus]|uniref:Uncharacterized protein n=1 Tax=Engystomops pustulosus TaxID=76066 RepID=A0AAV6ZBV2_ENGPU|nr:hypothetical protein GDO81_024666 [Engystomops pustulosus]